MNSSAYQMAARHGLNVTLGFCEEAPMRATRKTARSQAPRRSDFLDQPPGLFQDKRSSPQHKLTVRVKRLQARYSIEPLSSFAVLGDECRVCMIGGERSPVMERSVLVVAAAERAVVYRKCETATALRRF